MPIQPIPPATVRVAHAAFPKGHRSLRLAEALDTWFPDQTFETLFPPIGQPACSPWRLALVTILQFAEGLSDPQAAHAVRSRIDWQYVLRLDLADPRFDASVLSELRGRLITGAAEFLLCDTFFRWCRDRQLSDARGRQRIDSTHILAAVRALNRLEGVGETLRHALNSLAIVAPAWLRAVSLPEWRARDARRAEDDRLPATQAARSALTLTMGHAGWPWLSAVEHAETPRWVREVPAVATLRRVWMQHDGWDGTRLHWREADNIPPAAQFISSPDDAEAH